MVTITTKSEPYPQVKVWFHISQANTCHGHTLYFPTNSWIVNLSRVQEYLYSSLATIALWASLGTRLVCSI